MRKFRYNQAFHPVGADEYLKHLLNSAVVRNNVPILNTIGDVTKVEFKQLNCNVINMSYFDFMEELGIVNAATAQLKGAFDEWVDGV